MFGRGREIENVPECLIPLARSNLKLRLWDRGNSERPKNLLMGIRKYEKNIHIGPADGRQLFFELDFESESEHRVVELYSFTGSRPLSWTGFPRGTHFTQIGLAKGNESGEFSYTLHNKRGSVLSMMYGEENVGMVNVMKASGEDFRNLQMGKIVDVME